MEYIETYRCNRKYKDYVYSENIMDPFVTAVWIIFYQYLKLSWNL